MSYYDFKKSFLTMNLQMEKMLETISAIKNNKLRAKVDSVQNTRVKKWLQKVIFSALFSSK